MSRRTSPTMHSTPGVRVPCLRTRRRRLYALLSCGVCLAFCFMVGFETVLLPGLSPSSAPSTMLPVAEAFGSSPANSASALRTAAAALAVFGAGAVGINAAGDRAAERLLPPPNISVIMPCYGQIAYLEEGLRSILNQQYPPVEIIIVDDGSEDNCGEHAKSLLAGALAPLRRRAARQLQSWWGWSAADLRRFRDEVVRTPNRGVAHARNTGIRRARGDWICCMDADDTVSDTYFMNAMAEVAKAPETNLVYSNQQFFGESRWQWHVPDLRPDLALTNGPLPLMTLWRKALWRATPHGFDEALPRGHEDWAFWLQLMRLSLHPHKLDGFQVQYRYKRNSKMRNRERNNPEVPRLLRCLFPDLYPVRRLLADHYELLKPNGFSEMVRMDVSVSQHLHSHRAATHLWRGMILQAKRDVRAALHAYNASKRRAEPYDWQGSYRLWRLLGDLGDVEGAERERQHLLSIWGAAQFAWYSTDVHGRPLEFAKAAPGADITVGVIGQ
jgi:hypothetical protein